MKKIPKKGTKAWKKFEKELADAYKKRATEYDELDEEWMNSDLESSIKYKKEKKQGKLHSFDSVKKKRKFQR